MFRPLSTKKLPRSKSKTRQRWRLFHATDFQSLMYPCFIFCHVIGIFPYKINASAFSGSKARYILSTFVLLVFCGYGLVVFYQTDISDTLKYNTVPAALQGNCYYILGGIIAIVTYVMSGQRMRFLQALQEISSRLPPESYHRLSWLIHAKDIFGFFFLLGQAPNAYSPNVYQALAKVYMLYITLLVFQIDMLYMNCVCVLKACFKRINENLANLRELVTSDEPHLLRRIYHEQRNPFLLMELKALKKRHLMVSDTVQMLNSTFSLQLLATVVMTFGEITFSLYFYILKWHGEPTADPGRRIWYSYYTMPIVYYGVKIALMVWACETGKEQAAEIGTTVHDVLISTGDKQIKDELQLFSLQILHRENTFSAKGLTVDATLLTAIVGSITTYLLILIQFMVTANACVKTASSNSTVS
ncbi:PREDICTED: putative gustatory receptor 28b [Dinoponera quadriceps]|uniref:Gustatory receptor n=1 Tax=Dinoponera quadriceps TaxID=609295 RepID=A0A6P3XNW2_DINQU|nr:PREDICTED: putative gustatory receptor 28b [Dinoponera quadriceps]